MKNKILQYQELSEKYTRLLSSSEVSDSDKLNIRQELAIVERFKDHLLWQELSDDDKQQKRVLALSKMKRWDSGADDGQNTWVYFENVIELYTQIIECIKLIEANGLQDIPSVFRLYSILLIERDLMNETRSFNDMRHMDYYVFMNIVDGVKEIEVKKIKKLFHDMYGYWENRPYKEVGLDG